MPSAPRDLKKLSEVLDSKYRGPGGIRFGWDALLGLIPGIGDFLTSIASLYILARAATLGGPPALLLRMGLNIFFENLVGLIPVLGNIFDFFWRSNLRNLALLDAYLTNPRRVAKSSAAIVWLILAMLVFAIVAVIGLSFYLLLRLLDFAF